MPLLNCILLVLLWEGSTKLYVSYENARTQINLEPDATDAPTKLVRMGLGPCRTRPASEVLRGTPPSLFSKQVKMGAYKVR